MSCNSGTLCKDLYKCGTTLTIGTVPAAATDYLVYFKNWTTGKMFVVEATSTAGSVLSVTLPVDMIDADHNYQIWVTLASASNIDAKENITISSTVYTSLAVYFRTIYDTTNAVDDLASQSLIIA